jgi:hypothetical protein
MTLSTALILLFLTTLNITIFCIKIVKMDMIYTVPQEVNFFWPYITACYPAGPVLQ